MENKILYNLDKIISVYVYTKKINRLFDHFKPKGYYWWKIFGIIPLFKYHLEENTFKYVSDRVTEDEVIELTGNHCYIENEIVYYKPHVHIYFVGDDMTSYYGASFEKFFQAEQEMQDYCDKIIAECEKRNIQIKNIKEL